MRWYKKIKLVIFVALLVYPFLFFLWQLRPVKIITASRYPAYEDSYYRGSDEGFTERVMYFVVVDHLPLSIDDKVKWYLANKNNLKMNYSIPMSLSYTIIVWDIGDGFIDLNASDDSDLICLPKIEAAERCIEKNDLLSVTTNEEGKESFSFADDDNSWTLTNQGNLTDGKITFGL